MITNAEIERLRNEAILRDAENAAVGSQMLDLQYDCIQEKHRAELLTLLREGALRLRDVLTWVPNCTARDQARTWLANIDAYPKEEEKEK